MSELVFHRGHKGGSVAWWAAGKRNFYYLHRTDEGLIGVAANTRLETLDIWTEKTVASWKERVEKLEKKGGVTKKKRRRKPEPSGSE